MAVNVKLGVDLSSFNSGIREGQNILKGLNAEMKATEAEFKATGNAEDALQKKTKTLNSQLNVQKGIIDQAQKALKAMDEAGVKPTDAAYQKLYATMMNATAGMNETQAALNNLTASEQTAADGANELTNSINGISKKISLDQVISGIGSITSGLENAAKSAFNLGEELVSAVLNKAKLADDTATMAQMYGISVERLLKMNQMYAAGFDTSAEAILTSQDKLRKGLNNSETVQALEEMGVAVNEVIGAGKFGEVTKARDSLEIFFEAGQKILTLGEGQQVDIAQKLFGRSWRELKPLFDEYKTVEEYEKALDGITVASEDSYKNLATLNDTVGELKGNFDTLTMDILGALAPALTKVAISLNDLLSNVIEYLKTEDGQEMLQSLSDSVSSLFEDLGKIDPKEAVQSFTTVFNGLVDGLKWIVDNKDTLITALEGVVIGWGALKLTGGVLEIVKLIEGITGLGAASGAAEAGAATGAAWGGAFANAVMAAAPWLIGLYTLLNPAGTAGNDQDVMTSNGQVTEAGWEFWNNNPDAWLSRLEMVGSYFGDLASILGNEQALQLVADVSLSDEDIIKKLQDEIGLVPISGAVALPENQAALLSQAVGTVKINGVMHMVDENGNNVGVYLEGGEPTDHVRKPGNYVKLPGFANGLPWVPYDGYLALLHRGERVMTARENRNYTYNSNNYFGNVNLNNGLEIDALCDSIDRHNRRQNAGFGG